ncbi:MULTISPECIES: M28 family metallopeptidase [Salinibaculum]|uniref:M28 family metallopeptidase n=1 Tax=Salinibaculum TaxID=2732368 RepID=UPI0030CA9579
MDESVERVLGRVWHDEAPWDLLSSLAELDDRFGGHPGEAVAADRVADAFETAGLADVRQDSFELLRWTRGSTTLTVSTDRGERTFEALALPYSPSGDVSGPLVDVGHGLPSTVAERDVEGAVVVANVETPQDADRRVHRMEKVGHAAEAGAAAFLFVNDRPGQLPPTGALRFGDEAAIPGVGVSAETGAWLREYADEGATAHVRVEATTDRAESQNVRAALGPETDDAVLVLAHYDAHDVGEGALDNGCGVGVLVGAVRALARLDLECRVEVAATGCEEVGLLGSEALAERIDTDRLRAVVNVDGAGRFRDLQAFTHASGSVRHVVESVAAAADQPVGIRQRPHAYSDHWPFLRRGVPAVQLHSAPADDDGHWTRGWTHTRADTREKVDRRNVREHAMLATLLVRALTEQEVAVDTATVREHLDAAGAEPGMRAAGVWPSDWE